MRIAVSIKDRAAQQNVSNLFISAGASVQVCDDAAAILEVADDLQAIVLGLSAAPEKTFDALVVLRQHLANIPIFVVHDAAGERHAKRATRFGATLVISQELLPQRIGRLLQKLAPKRAPEPAPAIRAPGWVGAKADSAYEIQSMDLGAWLSIPGNRRLLGMEEPTAGGATPDASPAQRPEPPGTERTREGLGVAAAPAVGAPPTGRTEQAPDGLGDGPREQSGAQNAAILEAHLQREKHLHELEHKMRERLQAELRQELTQRITASEANMQDQLAEVLAEVRRDSAAAIRRVYLTLVALVALLALAGGGLALAWRLGVW